MGIKELRVLEKLRDKAGRITEYILTDTKGNTWKFNSSVLKEKIKANEVDVINLILTSDGRLIDHRPMNNKEVYEEDAFDLKKIVERAKILGASVRQIETECGHFCTLISNKNNEKHILYIPNNVSKLNSSNKKVNSLSDLYGSIRVIGGKNLESAAYMFAVTRFNTIDLGGLDAHYIKEMQYMFAYSCAKVINLNVLDTHNVTNMEAMFSDCGVKKLDLYNFDTNRVKTMHRMFASCKLESLNISSFNTSNVKDMSSMFYDFECKEFNLSNFDTHNVENMESMFETCDTGELDLKSFDVSKVREMSYMFCTCKAKRIDLSSFKLNAEMKRIEYNEMFNYCNSKIIATDNLLIKAIKERET